MKKEQLAEHADNLAARLSSQPESSDHRIQGLTDPEVRAQENVLYAQQAAAYEKAKLTNLMQEWRQKLKQGRGDPHLSGIARAKNDDTVFPRRAAIYSLLAATLPGAVVRIDRVKNVEGKPHIVPTYGVVVGPKKDATNATNDGALEVITASYLYQSSIRPSPNAEVRSNASGPDLAYGSNVAHLLASAYAHGRESVASCQGQGGNSQYVTAAASILNPVFGEAITTRDQQVAKSFLSGATCDIHKTPTGLMVASASLPPEDAARVAANPSTQLTLPVLIPTEVLRVPPPNEDVDQKGWSFSVVGAWVAMHQLSIDTPNAPYIPHNVGPRAQQIGPGLQVEALMTHKGNEALRSLASAVNGNVFQDPGHTEIRFSVTT